LPRSATNKSYYDYEFYLCEPDALTASKGPGKWSRVWKVHFKAGVLDLKQVGLIFK